MQSMSFVLYLITRSAQCTSKSLLSEGNCGRSLIKAFKAIWVVFKEKASKFVTQNWENWVIAQLASVSLMDFAFYNMFFTTCNNQYNMYNTYNLNNNVRMAIRINNCNKWYNSNHGVIICNNRFYIMFYNSFMIILEGVISVW